MDNNDDGSPKLPDTKKQKSQSEFMMAQEAMMEKFMACMTSTMGTMMQQHMTLAQQQMQAFITMQASSSSPGIQVADGIGARQAGDVPPKEEAKLPEASLKRLNIIKNKFEKKVRSYIKTKDRARKAAEEAKFMKENPGRYPAGTPACSIGLTDGELEFPWTEAAAADYTMNIVFPKGCTRRKAIETLHHTYCKWRKAIECEVAEVKLSILKEEASKGTFLRTCDVLVAETYAMNAGTELGCDPVQRLKPDEQELQKKFTTMYDDTIAKVYKDSEKKKEEEEKRIAKEKKDMEAMMMEQPETLMDAVIDSKVESKVAQALKQPTTEETESMSGVSEEGDNDKSKDKEEIERLKKLCASLQSKNGRGPGGAQDSSQQSPLKRRYNGWKPKGPTGLADQKGKGGPKGRSLWQGGLSTGKGKGHTEKKGKGKGAKGGSKGWKSGGKGTGRAK